MIVVGLTGGIGSGKSTVTELLARRGAVIIDADAIVHELQRPGAPLLDDLATRFGATSSRPMVPSIVASSPRSCSATTEAVKDLNAIVHPAVRAEIARRVAAHAGTDNVVVLDIPLLTERDTYAMAGLVVVDVEPEIAIERLVASRELSEEQIRARMAAQLSGSERLALADRVIDNSGDRDALERQVDDVWEWIHTLPPHAG